MKQTIILLSTLLTASLAAIGCKSGEKSAGMPPLKIEVATATTKMLCDKITFSTSTEAIRSVTIEPRVDGYLQSISYQSGRPIRRGDVIFLIDPTQIETTLYAAEAEVQSSQAALVNARNNYDRAVPLARLNAISATSLDEYRATYLAAEAALKSAEQSLRNAELNLSYATISSPIDGLIANSPANEGDYVGPGTKFETLTTIAQIDTLSVTLAIPTSRYIKYVDGKSYDNGDLLSNITLILPDSSGYSYSGVYDYTEQSASSDNSTVVIVVNFPNPTSYLKPNMFARVRADIGKATPRIVVPQRAVTQMQGLSSVWVINADSTLSYRPITVGSTYGDEWQVTSGLSEGERVATSGQLKLHQGAKVTPVTEKITKTGK